MVYERATPEEQLKQVAAELRALLPDAANDQADEQKEVDWANNVLEQAKAALRNAIGAVSDPNARAELQSKLNELNGITVNNAGDVGNVLDKCRNAVQFARAEEGGAMQETLMSTVIGLAGSAVVAVGNHIFGGKNRADRNTGLFPGATLGGYENLHDGQLFTATTLPANTPADGLKVDRIQGVNNPII